MEVRDFFRPVHLVASPSADDYARIKFYIHFADTLSRLFYQSIYFIDYNKREFLYVSDNPLFLCGKTPQQVLKSGFSFYLDHVPEEDLQLLLEINEAGFAFYNKIKTGDRMDYLISYDFRLRQPNGHLMLINHKLTPLVLDAMGNIWIALCMVSLSSNRQSGNIVITNTKEKKMYEYNVTSKKWTEGELPRLNIQEKQILVLSGRGLTVETIASELFVSVDTIKFHKRNIFKKLGAQSISEAILTAVNKGII